MAKEAGLIVGLIDAECIYDTPRVKEEKEGAQDLQPSDETSVGYRADIVHGHFLCKGSSHGFESGLGIRIMRGVTILEFFFFFFFPLLGYLIYRGGSRGRDGICAFGFRLHFVSGIRHRLRAESARDLKEQPDWQIASRSNQSRD